MAGSSDTQHGAGGFRTAGIGLLRALSAAVLAFMVLAICYDTLARYLFSRPTNWSLEVNGFMVLYLGTLGAVEALVNNSHIRLTLLSAQLPRPLGRLVFRLIALCGLAFCTVIAWRGGIMTVDAYHYDERVSSAFGTPMFLPYALLPVGFGLMALQFLYFAIGPNCPDDQL